MLCPPSLLSPSVCVKHGERMHPQYLNTRWCDYLSACQLGDYNSTISVSFWYHTAPFGNLNCFKKKHPTFQKCWERSKATDVMHHNNLAALVCKAREKVWALLSRGNGDASLIISFPFITVCPLLYLQAVRLHVEPCENDRWGRHSWASVAVVFIISKHAGTAPSCNWLQMKTNNPKWKIHQETRTYNCPTGSCIFLEN